jgi:hypothetical protein
LAARRFAARCLAARCSALRLAARRFARAFDAAALALADRAAAALARVRVLARALARARALACASASTLAVAVRCSGDVLEPRKTGGAGLLCVRVGVVAVVVTFPASGADVTFLGSELPLNAVRPRTNSAIQTAGSPILMS